jgi:hypothetical protein
MKKAYLIGGAAVVLALLAFAGGAFFGPLALRSVGLGGPVALGGPGVGGPMAQLSASERAKLQNMSASERQEFLQQKFGASGPDGVVRVGGPGGRGDMSIEGTVLEVAGDEMTVQTSQGGSQAVYIDSDTVMAYTKDSEQATPVKGDKVIVVAQPEGDNVIAATAVIIVE